MITDYETEVRPTEKRILHVTLALKDYTALLDENKRLRAALQMLYTDYLTPDEGGDYYPLAFDDLEQVRDALYMPKEIAGA